MGILAFSVTASLTAHSMSLRDRAQGVNIDNRFFSAVRSSVVIGLQEVSCIVLAVAGVVECVAKGIVEGLINACLFFSSNERCIANWHTITEPLSEGRKNTGYFVLANLFALYYNLTADNLKHSFGQHAL